MQTERCRLCHRAITKGRSNPQNKSYWKLIVEPLAEYLALTKNECHDLLKYKFNSEISYVEMRGGGVQEIKKIKSTTTMTTVEHNEFCSQIRIWASQLGCWLAEPGEKRIDDRNIDQ